MSGSTAAYDAIVIGGGIVGLAAAWQLQQRWPRRRIVLLEKERELARHQSGHNSGVIHAGIYYEPGSLKARYCRRGLRDTIGFCRQHGIPFEQCGKLLVASNEREQDRLLALYRRAADNGLEAELLDSAQLRQLEPNIVGAGAVLLRATGIVDYRRICRQMASLFTALGGELRMGAEVTGLAEDDSSVRVGIRGGGTLRGRLLVACAGLMADRMAGMMGLDPGFRVIPYRGEYFRLSARHNKLIRHLIYPVPDPELPFLGVHLTRMIDGTVTVGPNAVQGWKREGYGRFNFSLRDTWETLRYPGFWRVSGAHLETGLAELRDSVWKRGYLRKVRKYCPQIRLNDLEPYPAGVRAQAVLRDGTLVHDFLFAESRRSLHVCNAPSPAATSAIPIGGHICDQVERMAQSF
jgi:L-2-hydroxyglutarate oxidase